MKFEDVTLEAPNMNSLLLGYLNNIQFKINYSDSEFFWNSEFPEVTYLHNSKVVKNKDNCTRSVFFNTAFNEKNFIHGK